MLQPSTIQLLRFHFSFFLLPVFLFALSQLPQVNWWRAVALFAILHLLVYPASNGYNSYMDRDETPIGGLAAPMQPTRQLFAVTLVMDCIAVVAALFISWLTALGILFYIISSRAYSYRGIRLKKYPVVGFLTVFIFQGALVFYLTYHSAHPRLSTDVPVVSCFIASLLIGALYPLTQVYQHQEDKRDGVTTISYLLGKKGTFLFSMVQFGLATFLLYRLFNKQDQLNQFFLYLLILLPVVLFFLYWMRSVWQNEEAASFKNSLRMNLVSTFCTTAFFITLIILNH
jgi:1,4-dihydroxy-2-naphthoate polyprenyltransferase